MSRVEDLGTITVTAWPSLPNPKDFLYLPPGWEIIPGPILTFQKSNRLGLK